MSFAMQHIAFPFGLCFTAMLWTGGGRVKKIMFAVTEKRADLSCWGGGG